MLLECGIHLRGLGVSGNPLLEHFLEVGFTEKILLNVIKELEAFFIRNFRERVIWLVITDNWVERGISIIQAILLHITIHRNVSDVSIDFGKVNIMDLCADFSFLEDCEAFVEPKVTPVFAGDIITSPGMSDLMGSDINLRLVGCNDCWRGESQQWVFHSAHWERWWQDKDTIVAPNVWSQVSFSTVEECWE